MQVFVSNTQLICLLSLFNSFVSNNIDGFPMIILGYYKVVMFIPYVLTLNL